MCSANYPCTLNCISIRTDAEPYPDPHADRTHFNVPYLFFIGWIFTDTKSDANHGHGHGTMKYRPHAYTKIKALIALKRRRRGKVKRENFNSSVNCVFYFPNNIVFIYKCYSESVTLLYWRTMVLIDVRYMVQMCCTGWKKTRWNRMMFIIWTLQATIYIV